MAGWLWMLVRLCLVTSCCVSGFPFLSDHISIPYLSKQASWSPFFVTWDSRTVESTCCLMTMEILLPRSCCTGQWDQTFVLGTGVRSLRWQEVQLFWDLQTSEGCLQPPAKVPVAQLHVCFFLPCYRYKQNRSGRLTIKSLCLSNGGNCLGGGGKWDVA